MPRRGNCLMIMSADAEPGFDATLSLGSYPGWLDPGTWWLLVGGLVAVVTGVGLLLWPVRRREVLLGVEAHRMVDFADRIAERLGGQPTSVHSGRHHDM